MNLVKSIDTRKEMALKEVIHTMIITKILLVYVIDRVNMDRLKIKQLQRILVKVSLS